MRWKRSPVAHVGGRGGHRVQDALHAGAHLLAGGPAGAHAALPVPAARARSNRCALGLVQLQGAGERAEHAVGHAGPRQATFLHDDRLREEAPL